MRVWCSSLQAVAASALDSCGLSPVVYESVTQSVNQAVTCVDLCLEVDSDRLVP